MNSYLWLIKEPLYIGSVVVNDSRRTSNRHNFAKKTTFQHLLLLFNLTFNLQQVHACSHTPEPYKKPESRDSICKHPPDSFFLSFFLLYFFFFFFYKLQAQCSALTSFVCLSGIQLASQLKPGLRKALRQYLSMCYQSNLLPLDDFSKQRHVFKYFPFQVNLETHILLHH